MRSKLLIVGGAGYIGSHMVLKLVESGFEVLVLDNLSTGLRELVGEVEFIQGDLGDGELMDKLFREHSVSAVMHFAAFSQVGESMRRPLRYWRNNISKPVELLDAMARHGVFKFIFSSSAAVYGEPESVPIAEDSELRPTNPYGATKVAMEHLLADMDTAFGMKSVSLRYFNAAGADPKGRVGEAHEPETHLIPLVLRVAAGQSEKIMIYGTDYPTPDGTCVRDYIHVNDLASAHLLALEHLMDGGGSEVFNLGNSRGYSVREVIDIARKVSGKEIPALEVERRQGDPARLVASSEKIKRVLDWKPEFEDMETIVNTAWNWHITSLRELGG